MDNNQKIKILVVEDDGPLANALKDKLDSAGFLVLTAKDGKEGLKIGIKNKPDLILLDVLMPEMNGLEMLKQLRQNAWGRTAPVLVLSNDGDPEDIRETLKNNAADYLIKSDWQLEDVVKRIKEILRHR